MSTRGVYEFIDEHSTYCVYKQMDNYPSDARIFIQNALKLSWELPRFEASEFAAAFVAANNKRAGGVYLMNEQLDDSDLTFIEFLYEVSCQDGKIHVKALDTQKGFVCFNGFLDEFNTQYTGY